MKKTNMNNTINTRAARNPVNMKTILEDNRGHYSNLSQVLMELVDNSGSNFESAGIKDGHIDILMVRNGKKNLHVVLRDNGTGIMNIDQALSLGDKSGAQTASNDHGQGFKNLPVENIILRTVNINGEAYRVVGPFVEGVEIEECPQFDDIQQGTEFAFDVDYKMLQKSVNRWGEKVGAGKCSSFTGLVKCVAEDIGFVHGMRMKEFGYTISVKYSDGIDIETEEVKPMIPEITPFNAVDPKNGNLGKTQGVVKAPSYRGEGEIAYDYIIGEMVAPMVSNKNYFQKSMPSQGFYLYINGRYIGKTTTLNGKALHPSKNGYVGLVNIKAERASDAPRTAIAKTGFVESSSDYNRLQDDLESLCANLPEIIKRAIKNKFNEHTLVKALVKFWITTKRLVEREVQLPDSNDKIDVVDYTNHTAYEFKIKAGKDSDVYQMMRYIVRYVCAQDEGEVRNIPFDSFVLASNGLTEDAEQALSDVNKFLKRANVDIQVRHEHIALVGGETYAQLSKNV